MTPSQLLLPRVSGMQSETRACAAVILRLELSALSRRTSPAQSPQHQRIAPLQHKLVRVSALAISIFASWLLFHFLFVSGALQQSVLLPEGLHKTK